MASFTSLKPLLDAMSPEDLISAAEYISHKLDKQLASTPNPRNTSEGATNAEEEKSQTSISKPFPLFELPRELRDIILSYAVQYPSPTSTIHEHKQAVIHPLLHTNRQLRSEAAEPFFSQHKFVFRGDERFGRLSQLLSISGNIWNKFVKCVVLIPTESHGRKNPWIIFDAGWSAAQTRKWKAETGLGDGVVWTAMRRVGFGRGGTYEVMGEVAIDEGEARPEIEIDVE
ncbi:uncharacterized protein RCC_03874 [Ramularia collo-cygni]|uniref:F-box domain-containing protein n=1 Tax=Ramularia collo-cygni TaxID=112498 RepID=A0A2D3V3C8_9PEZI|nr:uncharacterized protein RCC_03874 [Ramularia collo-cygni]CZT18036.1 uncharacterized protein RCC_03874 [Ramularia collo-cygni]